jgi:hypothetical protein
MRIACESVADNELCPLNALVSALTAGRRITSHIWTCSGGGTQCPHHGDYPANNGQKESCFRVRLVQVWSKGGPMFLVLARKMTVIRKSTGYYLAYCRRRPWGLSAAKTSHHKSAAHFSWLALSFFSCYIQEQQHCIIFVHHE